MARPFPRVADRRGGVPPGRAASGTDGSDPTRHVGLLLRSV